MKGVFSEMNRRLSARSVLHPLEEIIGAGTADKDFETALRLGIDAQSAALQFYYALDC